MTCLELKDASNAEIKHLDFAFEVKEVSADARTFSGYASVFGQVDQGRDIVVRGAFTESLQEWKAKGKMPKMLFHHDTRRPIGKWVEMFEDDYGLFCRGSFTNGVKDADEAYALLKDDAIDGLSIGYQTLDDEYDRDTQIRKLIKLRLMETSIVTFPMLESAGVTDVKSFEASIDGLANLSDAERLLREAGRSFSRKEATDFVSKIKKIAQREAGDDQGEVNSLKKLAELIRS